MDGNKIKILSPDESIEKIDTMEFLNQTRTNMKKDGAPNSYIMAINSLIEKPPPEIFRLSKDQLKDVLTEGMAQQEEMDSGTMGMVNRISRHSADLPSIAISELPRRMTESHYAGKGALTGAKETWDVVRGRRPFKTPAWERIVIDLIAYPFIQPVNMARGTYSMSQAIKGQPAYWAYAGGKRLIKGKPPIPPTPPPPPPGTKPSPTDWQARWAGHMGEPIAYDQPPRFMGGMAREYQKAQMSKYPSYATYGTERGGAGFGAAAGMKSRVNVNVPPTFTYQKGGGVVPTTRPLPANRQYNMPSLVPAKGKYFGTGMSPADEFTRQSAGLIDEIFSSKVRNLIRAGELRAMEKMQGMRYGRPSIGTSQDIRYGMKRALTPQSPQWMKNAESLIKKKVEGVKAGGVLSKYWMGPGKPMPSMPPSSSDIPPINTFKNYVSAGLGIKPRYFNLITSKPQYAEYLRNLDVSDTNKAINEAKKFVGMVKRGRVSGDISMPGISPSGRGMRIKNVVVIKEASMDALRPMIKKDLSIPLKVSRAYELGASAFGRYKGKDVYLKGKQWVYDNPKFTTEKYGNILATVTNPSFRTLRTSKLSNKLKPYRVVGIGRRSKDYPWKNFEDKMHNLDILKNNVDAHTFRRDIIDRGYPSITDTFHGENIHGERVSFTIPGYRVGVLKDFIKDSEIAELYKITPRHIAKMWKKPYFKTGNLPHPDDVLNLPVYMYHTYATEHLNSVYNLTMGDLHKQFNKWHGFYDTYGKKKIWINARLPMDVGNTLLHEGGHGIHDILGRTARYLPREETEAMANSIAIHAKTRGLLPLFISAFAAGESESEE